MRKDTGPMMKKCLSTRPLCFWAWNGEMDHDRLRSQLRNLHEKGMAGVFIHSRAGLRIPYMGEEWMEAFGVAVEVCEQLGMQAWIYDEDGWPSGFGGGKVYAKDPDFVERYLLSRELSPGEALPEHTVALYRRTKSGFEQLDARTKTAPETCMAVYAEFNPVYIDILNPDAVRYFIEVTHEQYRKRFSRYFGTVIPGIFTDEPHFSPAGIPWGKYVPDCFAGMHGYSVFEALPYLFEKRGSYRAFRYDFWKNISAMILNHYARPYFEWCQANGLIFTGHYACEEGLVDQIAVSGGVMPLYEWQHLPGVDALGNRLVPAPVFKQAEAVAWQLGDRRVLCETYACSGYDATFSDIMWIWGYQAAMGVNVPCLSISMYSLAGNRKRDYPQFFSSQMPWWERFPDLSEGFSRINAYLLEGEKREGMLLIHPKTGVWCERGKDAGLEERALSSAFRRLTEDLLDLQREFDYGEEDILAAHAKVEGTVFRVGNRRYHTIMVPPTVNLEVSTLELLRGFAGEGGKVLFVDRLPELIGGRPAPENSFDFEKTLLAGRRDLLRKYFAFREGPQEIELIDRFTRRPALGFVTAVRLKGEELRMLAVSGARAEKRTVRLRVCGDVEVIKGDLYGKEQALFCEYDAEGRCSFADVVFDEQEVCFLTARPRRSAGQKGRAQTVSAELFRPSEVRVEENVLVVDRVTCTVDGVRGEETFPIFATADVFRQIDGKADPSLLKMRYFFETGEIPGESLALVCEDRGVTVTVNGIPPERTGWQWDADFGRYDLSGCVKQGKNEVLLERSVGPYRSKYDLDEVFQSVTNVFSYEYNVENIYILGRFDVVPPKAYSAGENCYWLEEGCRIGPATPKQGERDLTIQGLPFYAGKAEMQAEYRYAPEEGVRIWFEYDKPEFAAGELFVNGCLAGRVGIPPYRLEITGFLQEGLNKLSVKLCSTSRNLFGPFHHVKGRHNYIGPSVFKGVVEYEDPVVFAELVGKKTWRDELAVIPFRLTARIVKEELL